MPSYAPPQTRRAQSQDSTPETAVAPAGSGRGNQDRLDDWRRMLLGVPWQSQSDWKSRIDGDLTWAPWALPGQGTALSVPNGGKASLAVNGQQADQRSTSAGGLDLLERRNTQSNVSGDGAFADGKLTFGGKADLGSKRESTSQGTLASGAAFKGKETDEAALKGQVSRADGATRYDLDGLWSRAGSSTTQQRRADGDDSLTRGYGADVKFNASNAGGVPVRHIEAGATGSHDAAHHTATEGHSLDQSSSSKSTGRIVADQRDGALQIAGEGKVGVKASSAQTDALADGSRSRKADYAANGAGAFARKDGVTTGAFQGDAKGAWAGQTERKTDAGSHSDAHQIGANAAIDAKMGPGGLSGKLQGGVDAAFRAADTVRTDTGSIESGRTHGGKATGALQRKDGALSGEAAGTYAFKGDRTEIASQDGVDTTTASTYGGDGTGGLSWADGKLLANGKGKLAGTHSVDTVRKTADGEDHARTDHSGALGGSIAQTADGKRAGSLDGSYGFGHSREITSATGTDAHETRANVSAGRDFGPDAGFRLGGDVAHSISHDHKTEIAGGTQADKSSHALTAGGSLARLDGGRLSGDVTAGYTGNSERVVKTLSEDGKHRYEGKDAVSGKATAGLSRDADGTAVQVAGGLKTSSSHKSVDQLVDGTDSRTLQRDGALNGSFGRAADGALSGKVDAAYGIDGKRVVITDADGLHREATTAGAGKVTTAVAADAKGLRQTSGVEGSLSHGVATQRQIDGGTVNTGFNAALSGSGSQTVRPDGTHAEEAKAALALSGTRVSHTEKDGRTVDTGLSGGAKVDGGLVRDEEGKIVGTVGGQTSFGARRDTVTVDGDRTTKNSAGLDLLAQGNANTDKSAAGKASLGLSGSHNTVQKTADGSVTTDLKGKASVDGSLAQTTDGKRTGAIGSSASVGYGRTAVSTQGDTTTTSTTGVDLAGQGSHTLGGATDGKVTLGAGHTVATTTKTATGTSSSTVADRIDLSGTGNRTLGPDGKPLTTVGGTLAVGRDAKTTSTSTAANGAVTTAQTSSSLKGTASAETGKGVAVGVNRNESSSTSTVNGRTTSTSSDAKTQSVALSAKDGLTAKQTTNHTGRQDVTKLSDQTTLTTTAGQTRTEVGAGVKRDANGNVVANANAKANATLYGQEVGTTFKNGGTASAGYKVGNAEAQADGTATLTKDQVKVTGTAGAKVSLVEGSAKIDAPIFGWSLWGEDFSVRVSAAVSAGVLAEANGKIDLNISKASDQLGVTVGGGGHAFAGAKAGVEVAAALDWKRKPDYSADIIKLCKSVPGSVDDWIVDRMPAEFWTQFSQTAIGSGTTSIIDAKAGLTGSAGIGGDASFAMGLQGGKINVSGELSGTVGLGAGVSTDLQLDAVNGVRLLGVYGMRGMTWLTDKIKSAGSWMWGLIGQLRTQTDAWMEAKKKEGGLSGGLATVADFFGDTVFNLW